MKGKKKLVHQNNITSLFFLCKSEECLLQNTGFLNAINLSASVACLNCS